MSGAKPDSRIQALLHCNALERTLRFMRLPAANNQCIVFRVWIVLGTLRYQGRQAGD